MTEEQQALVAEVLTIDWLSERERLLRYDQWKRVFRAIFPEATPAQYELAMVAIAKRVGV